MRYTNPVVKGFYPDPSVCFANGKYYLACSSFQYFPGVPLFESENLVNWRPIGHVLTRPSQVALANVPSSGGVFAPTLRFHNGRFYMVTTNATTQQNFYVYTDDIFGPWSDPVYVDQGGIDPSLYFEDGRCFFMSNGADDDGNGGIVQCEIDIQTGRKLSRSKSIWHGTGGRFLESPHLYKIGDWYYLTAAEGGTEYGHMITYARSHNLWGPFEGYPCNPVLTNRNKAPFIIQGIGHGELVQGPGGQWFIVCLGFRQTHIWMKYHHLGREVFLIPVTFGADGWFTAGRDGTADEAYGIPGEFEQREKKLYTFSNTDWAVDWACLRKPRPENYQLSADRAILTGTDVTLNDTDSPTFIALRQRDFAFELRMNVRLTGESGEGGLTVYSCEAEHYEISVRKIQDAYEALIRQTIGGIHQEEIHPLKSGSASFLLRADALNYRFFLMDGEEEIPMGSAQTKYVSTEVSGGFTGVMLGLYAVGPCQAAFEGLRLEYQ